MYVLGKAFRAPSHNSHTSGDDGVSKGSLVVPVGPFDACAARTGRYGVPPTEEFGPPDNSDDALYLHLTLPALLHLRVLTPTLTSLPLASGDSVVKSATYLARPRVPANVSVLCLASE